MGLRDDFKGASRDYFARHSSSQCCLWGMLLFTRESLKERMAVMNVNFKRRRVIRNKIVEL